MIRPGELALLPRENTWQGAPVRVHEGTIDEIRRYLPIFERKPFALSSAATATNAPGVNPRFDTVVRMPLNEGESPIPVGIVSKSYKLIQHTEVLALAVQAIEKAKIAPADVKSSLEITEFGERMNLTFYLPERFNFIPPDRNPMGLRMECYNSVDGSTRLKAVVGWIRFICGNGLVVGLVRSKLSHIHDENLNIENLDAVLRAGLQNAEKEKNQFVAWLRHRVEPDRLAKWVNGPLKEKWGVKAATRAFHIVQNGYDAVIANPFEPEPPTAKSVKRGKEVPGAMVPGNNAFAISQALAWLAKERKDIQEQFDWMADIPKLVSQLLGIKSNSPTLLDLEPDA